MAGFTTLALGLGIGALAGGLAAKKLGGNKQQQQLQQQQTLAPAATQQTLAQPVAPAPLPTAELSKQAGIQQRKRSGGGVNLAQPLAPRSSTMPVKGSGLAKPRTLIGY